MARSRDIPLVLIGSTARGTASLNVSDIDLLMVNGHRSDSVLPGVHLIQLSPDQLAERVRAGDDFAQWALRFGKPLTCRDEWEELAGRLLEGAPWPRVARKRKQLQKRLTLVEDLFEMGDNEAAWEEVVSAVNVAARAVLLKAGSFPLSSPELAGQLNAIGQKELANAVVRSRETNEADRDEIESLLGMLKGKLSALNPS